MKIESLLNNFNHFTLIILECFSTNMTNFRLDISLLRKFFNFCYWFLSCNIEIWRSLKFIESKLYSCLVIIIFIDYKKSKCQQLESPKTHFHKNFFLRKPSSNHRLHWKTERYSHHKHKPRHDKISNRET